MSLADWNYLQRKLARAQTDQQIEDLIERQEALIHRIGKAPSGLRDLATLVTIGFDTDFSNPRVVGPMVMYSMRVMAQPTGRRANIDQ